MTDDAKQLAKEAFFKGFETAKPTETLDDASESVAETQSNRWWQLNHE